VPLTPEQIATAPGFRAFVIERLRRRQEKISVRVHIPMRINNDNGVDDGFRHLCANGAIRKANRMTPKVRPAKGNLPTRYRFLHRTRSWIGIVDSSYCALNSVEQLQAPAKLSSPPLELVS